MKKKLFLTAALFASCFSWAQAIMYMVAVVSAAMPSVP